VQRSTPSRTRYRRAASAALFVCFEQQPREGDFSAVFLFANLLLQPLKRFLRKLRSPKQRFSKIVTLRSCAVDKTVQQDRR
jgi:hypothetical protein